MDRIEGEKVYLRAMTEEDTDDIIRWRNHPAVRKNFIYQKLFTRESHLNWLHSVVETGKAVQFVIVDKQSGKSVGSVYLRDVDHENHKAEYGIFIGEDEARGKGIGTEAAQIFTRYGFEKLGLHRIYLRVFEENKQAIKSYEKGGFHREGLLTDDVCVQGEYRSIVWMAKICEGRLGE